VDESLEARVSALEAAVAALTAGAASPAAPADAPPGDVFWALEGLRARVGDGVLFTGAVDLPTGEHYDWQYAATTTDLLDADWSDLSGALAALGHPVRLRLLHRVLTGVTASAELAADDTLGTTGQLYHHLRHLVSAGWLRTAARGRYTVPGERVVPLLVILLGARR
jgi:hypothetical protein